jgi:formamidopyrimidine-DNA glycosylase
MKAEAVKSLSEISRIIPDRTESPRGQTMPELPEVETICQDLRTCGVLDNPIQAVTVLWTGSITPLGADEFGARLVGRTINRINRRGKYLQMELDDGQSLLIHLRMTGGFSMKEIHSARDPHDRVVFQLARRELVYHDTRKFGRMTLTTEPLGILGRLGPEPLDTTLAAEVFHQRLSSHRRMLKPLLLDQSFLAGLGNIYVDESLFAAKLHPCESAENVTLAEASRLLDAIRKVLSASIENRGTSLGEGEGNFASDGRYGANAPRLQVYQRTGKPCPDCATTIERRIVGQRATHFCPVCQRIKSPTALAVLDCR